MVETNLVPRSHSVLYLALAVGDLGTRLGWNYTGKASIAWLFF